MKYGMGWSSRGYCGRIKGIPSSATRNVNRRVLQSSYALPVSLAMPIKKRLQRIGRTSKGIILSIDMLAQMDLEDGDTVVLEIIGDALVVRKDGVPPPDTARVLMALDMMSRALPEGETLSERDQVVLQALRDAAGPLSARALAAVTDSNLHTIRSSLTRLRAKELVEMDGRTYRAA